MKVCICAAISAFYEVLEWIAAVISEDAVVAFLATQGDVWDTQKDIALCFVGAVLGLVCFGRLHDKQLYKIKK